MARRVAAPQILFGTGGLATELVGWLWAEGREVVCAISSQPWGAPEFRCIEVYPKVLHQQGGFLMGVSAPPLKRQFVRGNADRWDIYVHPTAVLSPLAKIGRGCVIGPHAVVTGNATLGEFVFLHAHTFVGHDAQVGDYGCLYPAAKVCGGATLGADCLMGAGATVLPNLSLPAGTQVSAGAVVRKSIQSACTVFGDPAQPRAA